MIVLENLIIIALVGIAIGYLIKLVYTQFSSNGESGCASCSGGCTTNSAFNKMPEIVNPQK
jgi:hypothetical protein